MFEAEGEIAGLEPRALAAAQDREFEAGRHDASDGLDKRGMVLGRAVVEDLDFQTVARPVQAGGGGGHTDGERAFVADRQLNERRAATRHWSNVATQAGAAV